MKKDLSGNMKDFISYENDLDGYTNKIRSRKDFSLKKRQLLSKVLLKPDKAEFAFSPETINKNNKVIVMLFFISSSLYGPSLS